jgi:RimJ/RimL family protein N-acetyltransferase
MSDIIRQDIQLLSLPSVGEQPAYLEPLIHQIWPHRAEEIYSLFVNGGSDIDANTDHPHVVMLNGEPIGVTGFYKYDDQDVGLCWHGIAPAHRGMGLSRAAFMQICSLAARAYPTARNIVELIPSDREHDLVSYFHKLGFAHQGEVANFDYLPKGPVWKIYRCPLQRKVRRRFHGEAEFWKTTRVIVHFVGVCGAGKSTLCKRLAERITQHGGKVIGTIDYDPHTPDYQRTNERAFSRELDLRNIDANFVDPDVHRDILVHTMGMLGSWMASDANVVLVDRWYESYDHLPTEHIESIEDTIRFSGFQMRHVFLVIANDRNGNDAESIHQRLLHTKGTRPDSWWNSGPDTIEEFVRGEQECQQTYRSFVNRVEFPSVTMRTVDMDWDEYEDEIVQSLMSFNSVRP